jgi:hypothetical protein
MTMFCTKCGKEIPQGTQICPYCQDGLGESIPVSPQENGNSIQQPEIPPPQIYADPPVFEPEPVQKPRKKGVLFKVVAIILLAAILISGITVLGYYTFLPAQSVLTTVQYFTAQKHNKYIEAAMKRSDALNKAMYEGSVKSESELSILLDKQVLLGLGVDERTADLVTDYLKNVSLRFNFGADIPNEQITTSLGLLVLKNPAMSLNTFMDKTRIGFSLPELSPTIIAGELKDLPRLEEVFPGQFTEGQLKAWAELDIWETIKTASENKLSAADAQKLTSTYSAALVKGLESGKMSIKRGQTTGLFDKEISCQEITVKLDPEAQKQIIMTLLDTLMDDDTVYNIIKNAYDPLYQTYTQRDSMLREKVTGETPASTPTELTKAAYKSIIKELKSNLKDMDEAGFPENITVKIYINNLDVVKYTVSIPVTPGGEEAIIAYENLLEGDDCKTRLSLTGDVQGRVMEFFIYMGNDYDESSDTEDIRFECGMNLEMSPESSIKASLIFSNTEELQGDGKVKKNINADLNAEKRDPGAETQTMKASFSLEGDETRNKDGLYTGGDYTGNIEITVPTLPQAIKLGFALDNKTTYGEKLDLPDLSKEKVLDWGTATQDDFAAYEKELQEKLSLILMMLGSM